MKKGERERERERRRTSWSRIRHKDSQILEEKKKKKKNKSSAVTQEEVDEEEIFVASSCHVLASPARTYRSDEGGDSISTRLDGDDQGGESHGGEEDSQ